METQLSLFETQNPCASDYGRKIEAYYRGSKNPLKGEYRGFDSSFNCHYVLVDLRLYYCHEVNYKFKFLN